MYGLATHASMCRREQRQQSLQVDVGPREKIGIPSGRFRYVNTRLPNYRKRHCYKSISSTVQLPRKQLRGTPDDDQDFEGTTQLRTSNASIPCVKRNTLHGRDTKMGSSSTSIKNRMNMTTSLLFSDQVQSIKKEIKQAEDQAPHEPG